MKRTDIRTNLINSYHQAKSLGQGKGCNFQIILCILILFLLTCVPVLLSVIYENNIIFTLCILFIGLFLSAVAGRYFEIQKIKKAGVVFDISFYKLLFSRKVILLLRKKFEELQLSEFEKFIVIKKLISEDLLSIDNLDSLIDLMISDSKKSEKLPFKIVGLSIIVAVIVAVITSFGQWFLEHLSEETILILLKLIVTICIILLPLVIMASFWYHDYTTNIRNKRHKEAKEIVIWLQTIKSYRLCKQLSKRNLHM